MCYWTALKCVIHYNCNLLCDYNVDQRTWMHNTMAVDNYWQKHQVAEYLMMPSHSLPYITVVIRWRTMRWEWNTTHWREGKYLQVCLGKFRRKGLLGRSRLRWEYNIEVGLIKMGWEGTDSLIGSGQGQVLGFCAHSNENMYWWFWYPGMWCCIPGLHYSVAVENSKPTPLTFSKLWGISWFTLLYGDWLACWLVSLVHFGSFHFSLVSEGQVITQNMRQVYGGLDV